MYIIEKVIQLLKKHKSKKRNTKQDTEGCDHLFIPIDSSGETLACSKCGIIIKTKYLHKK